MHYPLPTSSLLDGELIPDPKLLQIYVGRRWQTEMFSPFRPPGDSMELLQAEVVGEEPVNYDGETVRARRIEYRTLSAAGVASEQTLRSSVWVDEEGFVVRHDVYLINTKLRFDRRDSEPMLAMARKLLDLETVATMVAPRRIAVMIEFQQACRSYGDNLAVDNLDLRIAAGELYSLLGHNGAGKTTTIKMLVGLLRPERGHVRVAALTWPRIRDSPPR